MTQPKQKTIIIGLDGVPFEMMQAFMQNGVMPHTAQLAKQGVFRKMNSTIPEISSVAWSSMVTGANPAEHGVFGFTDLRPGTYTMCFPNFSQLKVEPFWKQWDTPSVIVNVPSTYPVRPMNGIHISGFVSIEFEKSVYPPALIGDLKDKGYRLDVDSQLAHKSMDAFLEDLDKTLDARIRAGQYLWDCMDWRTFMFVFTGTDRLMHFLYDAYAQKDHKYHSAFVDHFRKIDTAIGELLSKASDDDLVIMLSDHGFEKLDFDVYVNNVLAESGWLDFKNGTDPALENICPGTRAFALDPARIYLNLKGKYPCGTVEAADGPALLDELQKLFENLTIEGRKVIRDIYRKEQIYHGPCLDDAPDMVLVADHGFNLKAALRNPKVYDKGIFSGKHTQDTAFLLVKGAQDTSVVPQVPVVWDIKGIVEKA